MAIERDHAAIASDQTKFKVAEGRSKVAVRCDWGIRHSVFCIDFMPFFICCQVFFGCSRRYSSYVLSVTA